MKSKKTIWIVALLAVVVSALFLWEYQTGFFKGQVVTDFSKNIRQAKIENAVLEETTLRVTFKDISDVYLEQVEYDAYGLLASSSSDLVKITEEGFTESFNEKKEAEIKESIDKETPLILLIFDKEDNNLKTVDLATVKKDLELDSKYQGTFYFRPFYVDNGEYVPYSLGDIFVINVTPTTILSQLLYKIL